MSMDAALAELKADFGKARSVPVQAIAPYIAKTPGAAYKLAQRDRFPIPTRKVGTAKKTTYMVSLYDVAEFIGGAGDEPAPEAKAKGAKADSGESRPVKSRAATKTGQPEQRKPRLPAMSKMMRAMRDRMDETRMHLDLLAAVYAEIEAIEVRSVSKEGKPPRKRSRSVAL